jgi:hypothetical protein
MPREQTMNERYLSILDTISAEEPSLRQYMADIAAEIKEPRTMERETTVSLCRAFKIAYNYHQRYNLDLYELIDFVTEQTLLILQEIKNKLQKSDEYYNKKNNKHSDDNGNDNYDDEEDDDDNNDCSSVVPHINVDPFNHSTAYLIHHCITYLIRGYFPIRSSAITLNARRNALTYQYFHEEERYIAEEKYYIVYIDGMKPCHCVSSRYQEPIIEEGRKYKISDCFPCSVSLDKLETTIYTIEQYIEQKELFLAALNDPMARLTPREEKAMRLILGFDDGCPFNLEEISCDFGVTRERARQIASSAFRKLYRRRRSNYYYSSRYKNYTSICKCGQWIKGQIYPIDNFPIYIFCCKNCGRIYYSQLGQYKATCLCNYRLKGYIENPSNTEIHLADVFVVNGNVPTLKSEGEQLSKIHEWVERLRRALEEQDRLGTAEIHID